MGLLSRTPPEIAQANDFIASKAAEFEALRIANTERLKRYEDVKAEAEACRELDPALLEDYGRKKSSGPPSRHNISLPFGQALTVKHAHRISARMPEVVVERRMETPAERFRSDRMEKIVWDCIRHSKGEAQFASAAWDGSQLGSSCFEIYFDPEVMKAGFRAIDPAGALVVKGVDDPHNFQRFYRFWDAPVESIKDDYRGKTFRGQPIDVDSIQGTTSLSGVEMATIVQVALKDRTVRFVYGSEGQQKIGLYELVHDYGFVPYVVIPNLGPERAIWGWSDYDFVRDLSAYVSRAFSREADILRMISGGAYTEEKTGQSPEAVERVLGEGGVLPKREGGKVEPIEAPKTPDFADGHNARAVQFLQWLGFAPPAAWGDGNAGSGADRGLQMQPQNELTALKRVNWGGGLSRMFSMAFRMIEKKQVGTASYHGVAQRGAKRDRFLFTTDSEAAPATIPNPDFDPSDLDSEDEIQVPIAPKDLFDGTYDVRFSWLNRVDLDDPAYVASELNKFQQGVQSLRTTLENLGVDSPEDEMKLIEQEADRFPWLRQGMIALTKARLDASQQGEGGGPPVDPGTGLDDAIGMLTGADGAGQAGNAMNAGLGADSVKPIYGA